MWSEWNSWWIVLYQISVNSVCLQTPVVPTFGLKNVTRSAVEGQIFLLEPGIYSGPENCGLNLSIDNITIQGSGIDTIISCSGLSM